MKISSTVSECVSALVHGALCECCPPAFVAATRRQPWLQAVIAQVAEDAIAFAAKDPAARGRVEAIALGYTSFKAVLHYRLAHVLLVGDIDDGGAGPAEREAYAALIASRGKLLSGAELHPRCRIGRRFVLDHGVGTVIGETAELGDDCYVLGGVTLGAVGVAGNPTGKRHPSIGNRVEIGAFARVFGPVSVGDDAFIGAHCVITEDVSAGSMVTVRTIH